MKIYKPNFTAAWLSVGIGLFLALIAFTPPYHEDFLERIPVLLLLIFLISGIPALLFSFFAPLFLNDGFLWHRIRLITWKISVNSISEMYQLPLLRLWRHPRNKAVFVHFKNAQGKQKYWRFSLLLFDPETIAQLIYDLKKLNPSIKLDEATQQLMEQAKE